MTPTRGERNCNCGNLRYVLGIPWDGLAIPPHDEGGYCIFTSSFFGIRALGKDLKSKWDRGLRTVRKIIDVYAPPNENNTASYIQDVSDRLGINPDDLIDLSKLQQIQTFAKAVILHENGRCIYSDALIAQAVTAALA